MMQRRGGVKSRHIRIAVGGSAIDTLVRKRQVLAWIMSSSPGQLSSEGPFSFVSSRMSLVYKRHSNTMTRLTFPPFAIHS